MISYHQKSLRNWAYLGTLTKVQTEGELSYHHQAIAQLHQGVSQGLGTTENLEM